MGGELVVRRAGWGEGRGWGGGAEETRGRMGRRVDVGREEEGGVHCIYSRRGVRIATRKQGTKRWGTWSGYGRDEDGFEGVNAPRSSALEVAPEGIPPRWRKA